MLYKNHIESDESHIKSCKKIYIIIIIIIIIFMLDVGPHFSNVPSFLNINVFRPRNIYLQIQKINFVNSLLDYVPDLAMNMITNVGIDMTTNVGMCLRLWAFI